MILIEVRSSDRFCSKEKYTGIVTYLYGPNSTVCSVSTGVDLQVENLRICNDWFHHAEGICLV